MDDAPLSCNARTERVKFLNENKLICIALSSICRHIYHCADHTCEDYSAAPPL